MIAAMALEVIVWFYLLTIAAVVIVAAGLMTFAWRWAKRVTKAGVDASSRVGRAEAASDGKLPAKKRWWRPNFQDQFVRAKLLFIGGGVLLVFLSANALMIPITSNPKFCGLACHNMNPQYQTWRRSAHSQITCTACHVDPTLGALAYEKVVEGTLGMLHTVTEEYEKPINADNHYGQEKLPSIRCKRCHDVENRKFTYSSGIYMDHSVHEKAGIQCAVCHNRVTHLGAEKYEPLKSDWPEAKGFKPKNFLTMKEGCFRCHSSTVDARDEHTLKLIKNQKKPPGACTACHTPEFKKMPFGHEKKDWRDVHGKVAAENFKYCLTCHAAGKKYDYEGKSWCVVCHDEAADAGFQKRFLKAKQALP